jgi:hypothetical protein
LHFILRDRERNWHLASVDGAGPASDALDAGRAFRILSNLLRDEANLQAVRGLLQRDYPFSGRPIPNQARALLSLIEDRLCRRRWALAPGPEFDLRAGLTKDTMKGAGRTQTLRIFDFNTGDFKVEPGPESPAAMPDIFFSDGHESADWLVIAHGSEREPALALAHGNENGPVPHFALTAESGPALGFTHGTEAPRGSGYPATEAPA